MADEEIMAQDLDEYVQIKQLAETTSIKDTDIFIVDDGTTEEKKVKAGIIKNHVMAQVASEYPNYTEMKNAIEAATPKVSKAEGNVIEEKTDGLYVSEDISGTVPSMTQSVYNDIPNKTDGKIREITDAQGFPVPFAIMNDELETSSNVLSAQKVKSEISALQTYIKNQNILSDAERIGNGSYLNSWTAQYDGFIYIFRNSGAGWEGSISDGTTSINIGNTVLQGGSISESYPFKKGDVIYVGGNGNDGTIYVRQYKLRDYTGR